jgi:hypothetical protein
MFIAQQFEDGLHYIVDSGGYYGIIDDLEPTAHEKKKHKDLAELLDSATCGRLFTALKKRINLPDQHWQTLEAAVKDRNFLAHRFLLQFDYEGLTAEKEKKIVHTIYPIFLRLRKAVLIVRALKQSLDERTNQIDARLEELMKSVGVESTKPRKKTHR